jgi:teichoic acid transport system permease protein
MTDTAVTDAKSGHSLRGLALRHGLRPAGERPGLLPYIRQLWSYRHFIIAYANGRLVVAFTSARLGRLWQLLTPLINAGVYFLIFGIILDTRRGIPNFIAYLCTGLFVFSFTQTVVLGGTQSINSNLGLIRALHFPRASLPIAVTLTQFQNLVVSMAVLIGIVLVTGEPVTPAWLLLLPALLLQSLFNAGMALAMARLGAKITDLKQLLPFVMRTWMYASGVLYSVENFARHLPRDAGQPAAGVHRARPRRPARIRADLLAAAETVAAGGRVGGADRGRRLRLLLARREGVRPWLNLTRRRRASPTGSRRSSLTTCTSSTGCTAPIRSAPTTRRRRSSGSSPASGHRRSARSTRSRGSAWRPTRARRSA